MYIEKSGNPIDEVGLIISAITVKKHIAVLLRGFTWWMTREDQDWSKCEVLFVYTGKMKFVLIEKIDVLLLNEKADKLHLNMKRRVSTRGSRKSKQEEGSQVNQFPVKNSRG